MDINKAIRKQEKSHKRFLLFLGFIFFAMPLVLFLANKFSIFFMLYLAIIEILILSAIIASLSSNYLKYSCDGYKLKIKVRRFKEEFNIICDKVIFVHTEGSGPQLSIVMILSSRFRNKKINEIDMAFLNKHIYVSHYYYKIKKHQPEDSFFYIVINKGGYHKYKLLDMIYRSCVKAQYSSEAVENIKQYRNL
ncbi:hypothetical protein HMPREF1982_01668 [Clostridiales bacterium oral taxon 876 str. F0540]|nr:hypothetical protein HMPREF1982_01668 [Clostridiales bacterium oral taxon 876 str. F0540]